MISPTFRHQFKRTGILLLVFLFTLGKAHAAKPDQVSIAKEFLDLVLNEEYEAAWKFMDPKVRKANTLEDLKFIASSVVTLGKMHGKDIEHFGSARMHEAGKTVGILHRFKFVHDVSKNDAFLSLDVIFKDEKAKKIIVFQPVIPAPPEPPKPGQSISTSAGAEKRIGESETWEIDGKEWKVLELGLVSFTEDRGMLVIKVEYDFEPKEMNIEKATEIGIPIAQEAYRRGWLDKAGEEARGSGMTLYEDIGIALCVPGTWGGFRIKITPEDYSR